MANKLCVCANEAEILYRMYRTMNTLADAEWTGESMCCNDEQVHIKILGDTVTIKNLAGEIISEYTHPADSTDTFEQTTETLPSPFDREVTSIPVTTIG